LESGTDPVIDRKTMVMEKIIPKSLPGSLKWKISSGFPLAAVVLKNHCHLHTFSSNFYSMRKSELWNFLLSPVTDPRIRGIYFEELILLTLNISRTKHEKIALLVCPIKYLKKIPKDQHYEVKNLNFVF